MRTLGQALLRQSQKMISCKNRCLHKHQRNLRQRISNKKRRSSTLNKVHVLWRNHRVKERIGLGNQDGTTMDTRWSLQKMPRNAIYPWWPIACSQGYICVAQEGIQVNRPVHYSKDSRFVPPPFRTFSQKFGTWRSKCCISIKDCLLEEPPEEAPPMQILLIRLSDLYLSNSKMGNLCWLVGLKRKASEKCPCQFRQRSGLKLHPAQLPSSHILGEVLLKGSCCWWSPTRYQVDCPRGWNM